MTILEEVKQKYNIDLPISYGKVNDQTVLILNEGIFGDYVSIEYLYVKYFLESNQLQGQVVKQSLLTIEGKHFDKLMIAGVKENNSPMFLELLFDISNYF